MKILFLSIARFADLNERGIYTDLVRQFKDNGHDVHVVFPSERRYKERTGLFIQNGVKLLKVKSLNFQKAGFFEKGLATLLIEWQFLQQIKKHFRDVSFDLVLYSTPPITFTNAIRYIKTRDRAMCYLLLKDIFPQNAVDLGLLEKTGLVYKYFLKKEKALYEISDYIGCMSPANVDFLITHNPEISVDKVEINPNSIEPLIRSIEEEERDLIREKYRIPKNVTAFVYGGNLGKPQGIGFLIDILISNKENTEAFFIIVGDGTDYSSIDRVIQTQVIKNVLLMKALPKIEYDILLQCCDVGLIFLDNRFSIPNYPSRLLSYLEAKIPVLSATDVNSDVGKIMTDNQYGLWVRHGDIDAFNMQSNILINNITLRKEMGENGYQFLIDNYQVKYSYEKIMSKFRYV